MKRLLLAMVLAMSFFCANAQNNPWKQVNLTSSLSKGTDVFQKHFKPSAYVSFQLDEAAIRKALKQAPTEKNASVSTSSFIIKIPNSKGIIERFRVVEAASMEAGLSAAHPDIKSYSGQGVDNPGSRIRFDMSLLGFHASIMSSDRKTFYISCVDKASKSYIVYERELTGAKKYEFDCLLDESINNEIQGKGFNGITDKNANTNTLRVYRLALNLAGELSRAVLADVAPGTDTSTDAKKKAIVLSLANSITTEANTYFENEMNLRLVLINNETDIIYLDPATDPFSTWTPTFTTSTWNTQTQTNCTNVIGTANYDIGHMLTYNTEKNNGNAGCIGCVCKTPSGSIGKGRGWNMYGEYQGYYFVVDYWTHEMGHQFGGNHTFTHNYEGTIAQVEPGSGTTIMAYAGITGATDVQSHSDPFFSVMSIQQITDYIQTGTGNTCGSTLALTNNRPTANGGSNYTIPKSTPFVLTGTSTDADAADVRTYSWEQIDARSSTSNTYPTATSTAGPMFRFFPPVTSLSRSFPRLEIVLDSNNTGKWEVLPSVARTMNFRFIVRDNHNGISANESDDVQVTVSSTAGPFAVTAPNTGVSLTPGSSQTVTWSVNSTNTATYATNVKITMSIDGGQTFPYVLAASTANDGTEAITVPSVNSGACRVKIEAIGNIFYDISNVNFAVGACGTAVALNATSITGTSATLSWTAVTGATSYDVDYRVAGAASWTTGIAATTSASLNVTGLTQGTNYEFRVKTNCAFNNGAFATEVFSTLCSTAPASLSATAITNSTATLNWSAATGAVSYQVDFKLSTESIWVKASDAATGTSINIYNLIPGKLYNFRVASNCSAGTSSAFTASTFTSLCSAAPSGLAASAITASSATLSWSAASGAASYTVDYKLASSGTWTNAATATTSTTVNLNSLTQGLQYDYRVRANCASGNTAYTSASFTTLCSVAPSGLVSSAVTNSSATINWGVVTGAASYDVDYKLASSGTWTNAATATTSTTVNLSSLTTGAQYDYRVRTNCASGSTTYTSAQFTTLCNVAPSGLASSSVTNASATVSWSAATGAVSYDVDYKLASSGTWANAATATTSTTVNLSSLTTGATYDYRVRANCASGSTTYTSAQFTTLCNVAPSGLASSSVTNASATVSWSAATGAVSYDVDYKLASSGTWTNAATATTSTTVNLSSLTTGATYDYRVRANCVSGSTTYTSAQFTTLCNAVPSGLSASSITVSSATISWSAATGATSYDVDYKEASSGTWINAVTATTSTSVNLSGLNYSTIHDWRVRTNCSAGSSSYASAQFTTNTPVCNDPSNLISLAITTSSATISWNAVTGAASYDVDYKEASSGTWINAATGTTSVSVNVSGLNYSSTYDWRVRTNCIYGNTSSFITSQFTTDIPACNTPGSLSTPGLSASTATVNWSAVTGAVSYDVDYKLASSGTWTNAATATTSTSVAITGLNSATTYDWRVRTNCIYGNTSDYSAAQFRTYLAAGCSTPLNLTTTSITDASATLNWDAAGDGISYNVGYKESGTANWINIATGTTSTSVSVSGLKDETLYEWRVRTNCASDASAYSIVQFSTLYSTLCPGKYDTLSNNTFVTASLIPVNRDVYGMIETAGDVDYYKFVMNAAGFVTINLTNLPKNYNIYLYNNLFVQTDSSTRSGIASESIYRKVGKGTQYVKVVASAPFISQSSLCYTLSVTPDVASKSVGISTEITDKKSVQLYPNPAHTSINIATAKIPANAVIKISDVYGRSLMQLNAQLTNTKVDISRLTAGTYLVTIVSKEGAVLHNTKFIKY